MEITTLLTQMQKDPQLVERMKSDPVTAVQHVASANVLASDVLIYRIVVIALGLGVILAIVGSLSLAFVGKPTPDVTTAIGSGCMGALAGLLVPSPNRN